MLKDSLGARADNHLISAHLGRVSPGHIVRCFLTSSRGSCEPLQVIEARLLYPGVSMVFFLSKFLPNFICPLGIACLLLLVSLFAQLWKRSRTAIATNIAAFAILFLMGNSGFSRALARPLETDGLSTAPVLQADAIVVLGGVTAPPVPPQPVIHLYAGADRLTYGAELYRAPKGAAGCPKRRRHAVEQRLTAGIGSDGRNNANVGCAPLGDPRRIGSRNTHENALYSSRLLLAHNLHKILLVTSALAMPRALAAFRHQGIDAIPAPTDFTAVGNFGEGNSRAEFDALNLMPEPQALENSTAALHEYVGLALYRMAGWI